jgi:delta 1-pyrroline-5-carboxylate dehydrogenase
MQSWRKERGNIFIQKIPRISEDFKIQRNSGKLHGIKVTVQKIPIAQNVLVITKSVQLKIITSRKWYNTIKYVVFRNPFNGSTVASVADCDEADTAAAIAAAADAFQSWRSVLPRQRSAYLR